MKIQLQKLYDKVINITNMQSCDPYVCRKNQYSVPMIIQQDKHYHFCLLESYEALLGSTQDLTYDHAFKNISRALLYDANTTFNIECLFSDPVIVLHDTNYYLYNLKVASEKRTHILYFYSHLYSKLQSAEKEYLKILLLQGE